MSDEIATQNDRRVLSENAPMTVFEYQNTPDTGGWVAGPMTGPQTTYVVDWDQQMKPTPRDFYDVMQIEVDLLTLFMGSGSMPDELLTKQQELRDSLRELRELMLDVRGIDDEETRAAIAMGDINELSEVVEKKSDRVQYGEWPEGVDDD